MYKNFLAGLLLAGVALSAQAKTIEYHFGGKLTDPFGSLAVGTAFTGSIKYDEQPLNTPHSPNRGDYVYNSFSLTIGQTTVTDNGTGVINMYNNPGYPTDLFHLYTYNVNGSFGGLKLAPGAGMQLVFQDVTGTAWNSLDLPGSNLNMSKLTQGNATFIQLQEQYTNDWNHRTQTARGELEFLSPTPVPEPETYAMLLLGLGGLGLMRRMRKQRA